MSDIVGERVGWGGEGVWRKSGTSGSIQQFVCDVGVHQFILSFEQKKNAQKQKKEKEKNPVLQSFFGPTGNSGGVSFLQN